MVILLEILNFIINNELKLKLREQIIDIGGISIIIRFPSLCLCYFCANYINLVSNRISLF